MQLYPAIDLKDGKCVRLKQGEFDNMTVYSDEPYKVARYFEENGATFIHLVDLDGALKGHSVNEETIKKRLVVYNTQTSPLKEYYKGEGKYQHINGLGTMEGIFEDICKAVDTL